MNMNCPRCKSTNISVDDTYGKIRASRRTGSWLLPLLQLCLRALLYANYQKYGAQCRCLDCEYQWLEKKNAIAQKHWELLDSILGEYPEMNFPAPNDGCLQLNEKGIIMFRDQKQVFAIAYDQITAVDFRENLGPLYGWLSVRYVRNRKKPFPQNFAEAQKDRATVFYPLDGTATYRRIFTVLKRIAAENKKAGIT